MCLLIQIKFKRFGYTANSEGYREIVSFRSLERRDDVDDVPSMN